MSAASARHLRFVRDRGVVERERGREGEAAVGRGAETCFFLLDLTVWETRFEIAGEDAHGGTARGADCGTREQ